MSRNGNRPGERAAHSVGSPFKNATEATSLPNRTQAQCQVGSDKRRPGSTAGADFQRLGLYPAPAKLRHYCRNPRCRMKLPAAVENAHRAFCTRGCYESFYRNRCRVCERDLRKTGKCGDATRMYCRPPANCRREAEKWPEKYGAGNGSVLRRRSSEVPIPRALNSAWRATHQPPIVCAVGGGAETAIATTRSTTETA
jgi:hypothetical protein